jgi:hypothetical protein
MHDAVALHFAELLRQHFLRDAGEGPLQLGEALDTLEQLVQDQDLPATSDHGQRNLCGTLRDALLHAGVSMVSSGLVYHFGVRTFLCGRLAPTILAGRFGRHLAPPRPETFPT